MVNVTKNTRQVVSEALCKVAICFNRFSIVSTLRAVIIYYWNFSLKTIISDESDNGESIFCYPDEADKENYATVYVLVNPDRL